MAEHKINGRAAIQVYTKDGVQIYVPKPECCGMKVIESIFDGKLKISTLYVPSVSNQVLILIIIGTGPQGEIYEGKKRYFFPDVHSEPFNHAIWVAAHNYESKTKNPSFNLANETEYGKAFLKTLTPVARTDLLQVANIVQFPDLVELINKVLPDLYVYS